MHRLALIIAGGGKRSFDDEDDPNPTKRDRAPDTAYNQKRGIESLIDSFNELALRKREKNDLSYSSQLNARSDRLNAKFEEYSRQNRKTDPDNHLVQDVHEVQNDEVQDDEVQDDEVQDVHEVQNVQDVHEVQEDEVQDDEVQDVDEVKMRDPFGVRYARQLRASQQHSKS